MRIKKPLPLLLILSIVLLVISAGVIWRIQGLYDPDTVAFFEVISTLPALVVVLGFVVAWQYRLYRQKVELYRRFQRTKAELAKLILDLEAFEVTFETVPSHIKEGELSSTWDALKNLSLALLKHQDILEKQFIGSRTFKLELENFEDSFLRAQELGGALMGSGSFWSGSQADRTVFDILLRPISPLVRELLFYLEDVRGTPSRKNGAKNFVHLMYV